MNEMVYYDLRRMSGLAPSLSTQVARELGRRIVSGAYPPGTLIEDEGALAARFHVSRSVIRDAAKILVGKGLLEIRRGIGTRVRERASWGLLDDDVMAWHQSAPQDAERLYQLTDFRKIVEPKAARLAAERGSESDHAEIRAAIESMEAAVASDEAFIAADAAFHRAILRAAKNEFVSALEGVIFFALLSSIRLTNASPSDNAHALPFHQKVHYAIAARDGDSAEAAMETLLRDTDQQIRSKTRAFEN